MFADDLFQHDPRSLLWETRATILEARRTARVRSPGSGLASTDAAGKIRSKRHPSTVPSLLLGGLELARRAFTGRSDLSNIVMALLGKMPPTSVPV